MSTTLTIPADAVPVVRKALFCLMGDGTESINLALAATGHEHHREWFTKGRELLQDVFPLLDLIGWDDSDQPQDVELDVHAHAQTLHEAADGYLPLLTDQLAEADINDAQRANEGKPPTKQELINDTAALRNVNSLAAQHTTDTTS